MSEIKRADNYDIEWHINMVLNDIQERVGQWALLFIHSDEVSVSDLQAIYKMVEGVVEPAMRQAHKREYERDGYHFTEPGA